MGTSIFGTHATAMLSLELAVIPIGPDRQPYVSGFQNWRHRPGALPISRWAEMYPEANIGVLPGLCGRGAVVADCDAMEHAEEFQDRFGKSNLRVRTRRGFHLWYGRVDGRLPGNLRKYGLEVDFKTGGQIAIAPPSVHETGHVYQLDGCDWSALKQLRSLNIEALHQFMGKAKPADREPTAGGPATEGQRATTLNTRLITRSFECGGLNELLGLAHAYNSEFLPALTHAEVVKIATKVWRDKVEGKIERWKGVASMQKQWRKDLVGLCQIDPKHGPDAYSLLLFLYAPKTARTTPLYSRDSVGAIEGVFVRVAIRSILEKGSSLNSAAPVPILDSGSRQKRDSPLNACHLGERLQEIPALAGREDRKEFFLGGMGGGPAQGQSLSACLCEAYDVTPYIALGAVPL